MESIIYIIKRKLFFFQPAIQLLKVEIPYVLALIITWIIMTILVNPLGDFPLNDDWAYGRAVQSMVEKGDFRLSGWNATNLFTQVFWGALFCLPFGFSFTALRFSTLTLGLVGVIATYGLLREANSNKKVSLLGAFIVAINPIYFALSNTFMSDVPFFAFSTLSLYFLVRGLRKDSYSEVIIGSFLAYFALLIRQLGLIIVVAFSCAYIIKKSRNLKNYLKGLLPTVLGIFIQIIYAKALYYTGRLPVNYQITNTFVLQTLSSGIINIINSFLMNTLIALIYLGLFVFPFLIILYYKKYQTLSSRMKTIAIFTFSTFVVVVMSMFLSKDQTMPLIGNVLMDFGIGPVSVDRSESLPGIPTAPKMFWLVVTAIGVIGAALLLCVRSFLKDERN